MIIYFKTKIEMEEIAKTRRMRKVSSWMSDAVKEINHQEEMIAAKKIVLKILRYMEANHLSQKQLAEKLGVSPQYINKFLHGQEWDIKISTAIRYGRILGLKLLEIPDDAVKPTANRTILLSVTCGINPTSQGKFIYPNATKQSYKYN